MFNRQLLRTYHVTALAAIAFFMPLSVWLLSFFIVAALIVWIIGSRPSRLPSLKKERLPVLIFFLSYLVYLIWMTKTTDLAFGLRELKMKLPLLVFPVLTGLSEPLTRKEMKIILSFFVTGVIISSLTGVIFYLFERNIADVGNPRKISMFITHISLAEMANLSIVISLWYFFTENSAKHRYLFLLAAIWLTAFLFILLSLTGIIIFSVLLILLSFVLLKQLANRLVKISLGVIVIALFLLAALYLRGEINAFYRNGNSCKYPLAEKTKNGRLYRHYPERKDIENGNPVWVYICEEELRKEWNSRSSLRYDSLDNKRQQLRFTLIRYLASCGLTKDSAGMARLKVRDISFIENGITNTLFTLGKPIKSRIYEIIWQIDYWMNGGNPSGHSVTQRFEYLIKGWHLFRNNMLTGTGTGDIKSEFREQFRKEKSPLGEEYIYLPHNQYLTLLISFGLTGFIIIIISFLIPVLMKKNFRNPLFIIFIVIIMISMCAEDTFETHTGLSFFAYFYALFIFGNVEKELMANE
jgi:O-antigen ligase